MHTNTTVRRKKRQMKYQLELICIHVGFWTLIALAAVCLLAMIYTATLVVFSL